MTKDPQPVEVGLLGRGGELARPTRRIAALERGDGGVLSPRVVPGTRVGGRDGVRLGAGTAAQRRVDQGAGRAAAVTAVQTQSPRSEHGAGRS
jgi:hypothetical protein